MLAGMTDTAPAALDVDALRRLLDGEHAEIRALVRATLSEPRFDRRVVADLPRDAYRDQVLEWARMLAAEGLTTLGFPRAYGGESNVGASVAAFETLAHGDLSLLVKVGVQFGCGAAPSCSSARRPTTSASSGRRRRSRCRGASR